MHYASHYREGRARAALPARCGDEQVPTRLRVFASREKGEGLPKPSWLNAPQRAAASPSRSLSNAARHHPRD